VERVSLEAIAERAVPLTGRIAVSLAETLLKVLDLCEQPCPAGSGNSFTFGYMTQQRVVAASIKETDLPE
jgi:hypothetical protein